MITVCLSPCFMRTEIFVLFTDRSQVPRTVLNTLWAIYKYELGKMNMFQESIGYDKLM